MTIRSVIHDFYHRLQLANNLRIWKELPTSNNETILFDTDNYGVDEDWSEWDASFSID